MCRLTHARAPRVAVWRSCALASAQEYHDRSLLQCKADLLQLLSVDGSYALPGFNCDLCRLQLRLHGLRLPAAEGALGGIRRRRVPAERVGPGAPFFCAYVPLRLLAADPVGSRIFRQSRHRGLHAWHAICLTCKHA